MSQIEMRKILIFILVGLTFFTCLFTICGTWVGELKLQDQYMPTAINGMTTCTSLIVGFSATVLALGLSSKILDLRKDIIGIVIILLVVGFSVGSFCNAYWSLGQSEFQRAFRHAMTGLYSALGLLFLIFLFLLDAIDRSGALD